MKKPSKELIALLNKALETEHQAYIQYLSHAELVDGPMSEPIESRLKEIAEDEEKHQAILRTLIGKYLSETPAITMAQAHTAKTLEEILKTNLQDEFDAVNLYTHILEQLCKEKASLPYTYLKLEHDIRHIIMDEQEHIAELKQLLGIK